MSLVSGGQQDFGAGQLQKAEKVLDRVFPTGDEAPRVVQPGEDAFDLPSTFGPADGAAVLGLPPTAAMAGNHFDTVVVQELRIERVAVVSAIADQSIREVDEEAGVERGRDEVRLIR